MIQSQSQIVTHWTDIVALCISIAAAAAAASAAVVTYLLYRSQSDPDVIVYAEADEGRPSIINLVIENKGKASAYAVNFSWSGKLPAQAWGIDSEGAAIPEEMEEGPLVHGIPYLPPGGRRVITWGQYGGIHKGLGGNALAMHIQYGSKRRLVPGYRTHENDCPLEIRSFEATDASDRNWDKKIASNLEELKKSIERESRSWMGRLATMSEGKAAREDGDQPDTPDDDDESRARENK